MAYNSALICPTKYCLWSSCSSHDSASDGKAFIVQLSNMAARIPKTANDL